MKCFELCVTLILSVLCVLKTKAEDDLPPQLGVYDDLSHLTTERVQDMLGMDINEVKERVVKLFSIIDKNNDKIIDDSELESWTTFVKNEVFLKQVNNEMKQIDLDKDGFITLSELNEAFSQNLDGEELEKHSAGLLKRFQIVDKDKDGKLNINEVAILVNPMKDEQLKELEVTEIMEHHDLDKDQRISLEEFKQTRSGEIINKKEDEALVLEDFNFFDTNKDGFIDKEEIFSVYFDSSNDTGAVNVKELRSYVFETKEITFDLWNEYASKIAVTAITDFGDVIRYPEDFKLDIGKNIVVPSAKTSMDEDDLDAEETEGEGKTDASTASAPASKDVPDEL